MIQKRTLSYLELYPLAVRSRLQALVTDDRLYIALFSARMCFYMSG